MSLVFQYKAITDDGILISSNHWRWDFDIKQSLTMVFQYQGNYIFISQYKCTCICFAKTTCLKNLVVWVRPNCRLGTVPHSHFVVWVMIIIEGPIIIVKYRTTIKAYNYLCNQCLSLLMLWVRISMRAKWPTLYDKVCQWLTTGRWFSSGPPVSSTNKSSEIPSIFKIFISIKQNK
jgi:hypothetical protein